jgi:hypothetical protein
MAYPDGLQEQDNRYGVVDNGECWSEVVGYEVRATCDPRPDARCPRS